MTSLHAGSGETSPTNDVKYAAALQQIIEGLCRAIHGESDVLYPALLDTAPHHFAMAELALTALRAASDREAALRKEIDTLSTPDVIGFNDVITYEEEAFEGMSDYLNPNDKPRQVWANRSFGSEWYAARVVASWDADGDVVDDEIRVFRTLDEANAALAESEAKRVSALSSDEQTNE